MPIVDIYRTSASHACFIFMLTCYYNGGIFIGGQRDHINDGQQTIIVFIKGRVGFFQHPRRQVMFLTNQ